MLRTLWCAILGRAVFHCRAIRGTTVGGMTVRQGHRRRRRMLDYLLDKMDQLSGEARAEAAEAESA